MNDYILSKVINPDESPTYFNMLSNYSGDDNWEKSVVVPSIRYKMLAVLTDGSKSSDHHM